MNVVLLFLRTTSDLRTVQLNRISVVRRTSRVRRWLSRHPPDEALYIHN
jgi:hypothetical protein